MLPSTDFLTVSKVESNDSTIGQSSILQSLDKVSVTLSPEEKFQEYLSSRDRTQRFTAQQRAMVRFIFSQHEHFDADGLFDEMKSAGISISRATAYRTLNKLVDAGLLRRHETGGRTRYEHDYGYPHHDHLHCVECGVMIEFQVDGIDSLINKSSEIHGFKPSGHSLIIQGSCMNCRMNRSAQRRLDRI